MTAGLDSYQLMVDRLMEASIRRWLCADCGRRLDVPPPREDEAMSPTCCDWEMVELPPADPREPFLTVVE